MKNKNKIFTSLAVLGSAIFAMVLTASTGVFEALGLFNSTRTTSSNATNLILNEDNAYSSGSSQIINTTFGKNPIVFDYSSGCSSFSGAHVNLADGATVGNYYKANNSSSGINWNNKLTSIESIKPVFSASSGASLQFRASYDGKTTGNWGEFAPLTSNTTFTLTSKPYYIELKAVGGSVSLTSCEICYACLENADAHGTPLYETGAIVNGGEKLYYAQNGTFDNLLSKRYKGIDRAVEISTNFDVVISLSNKATKTLYSDEYKYEVRDPNGNKIDTSEPFEKTGIYHAFIDYGSLPQLVSEFEVVKVLIEDIDIPSTKAMSTGEHSTISATITPSNADYQVLSWTSSDTSVAEIDNSGNIYAKKVGTTNVTAAALDISGVVSNTCIVTVSDVPVGSVSFEEHSLRLKVGESSDIIATVLPVDASNKSLTWTSTSDSIATVSNGTVTGVAEGEVTITATSHNGISDSCEVLISNAEPVDPDMQTAYETAMTLENNQTSMQYYPFSGVVVGTRNSSGNKDVYIQSGDYALDMYNGGYEPAYRDKVAIKSKLKKYSGLPETDAVLTFENKGQANLPPAKQIFTASDLANAKLNTLVSTQGVISSMKNGKSEVTSFSSVTGNTDLFVELSLESGSEQIYIKKNSYSDKLDLLKTFAVGDIMIIENGIRGIYDTTDQVLIVNESVVTRQHEEIHVTSVTVSPSSAEVYDNGTVQLSATVSPNNATNKKITWSSDDSSIASVDNNGLVSGHAAGSSTTIRATSQDGSKVGSCVVSVKAAPVVLNSISVSENHRRFNVGDTFVKETVTAHYSNGTTSIVTDEATFSGYNMQNSGVQTVSVSYGGKSTTYTISVVAPTVLSSISISDQKTSFRVGDDFNFGGIVTAHYSDGTSSVVTSYATFSGYDMDTAGTQTVTVTYVENSITKTTTYSISVTSSVVPSGDTYQITFSHASADGTQEIDATGIRGQISTGSSYISEISQYSKIYAGQEGLKMGSGKSNGYLEFTPSSAISSNETTSITIYSAQYSGDTGSLEVFINDDSEAAFEVAPGDTTTNTYVFNTPRVIEKVWIQTSTKRAYLSGITFTCKPTEPVDPEAISLSPTNISLGLNQTSEKINVSYFPSNANQNLGITWTSSNTSVATVSNGVVTAKSVAGSTTITATGYNGITATCNVTVNDIKVTSVTVNPSSQELTIGDTADLSAVVKPDNASNKAVTWSTSKSTVATVSSTGTVTAIGVGTATITATAKDGSGKSGSATITVTETQLDKWTILVYICGADLESDGGQASGDIREMLNVSNQPSDVNIVIQTGGSKSWSLGSSYIGDSDVSSIPSNQLGRWHVSGKRIWKDEFISNANMGSSSTYQSFLSWGLSKYPAQKTGVVLWNHGGGLDGVCFDENYNDDALSNSEMKTAHKNAIGSNKLDFIGYDACLMQCADIADANSTYFKYQVASQESENGSGWYYTGWIDNVYSNNTAPVVCKEICDTFISTQGSNSDQTLSYLDLSYASDFKTAFNNYATALSSKFKSSNVNKNTFANWAKSNIKNYSDPGYCGYGQFDIKDWLNKCQGQSNYTVDSAYITALNSALSNFIAYNKIGTKAGNSNGLCLVYCCTSQVDYSSGQYAYSNWASFNNTYGL